jgi:hypothetical protein
VPQWASNEWRRLRTELRDWGAIAFAGYATFAFAVCGIVAFLVMPRLMLWGLHLGNGPPRAKALNDARASVLQLLGGLVILAGAYLTARGVRLNRASHISDRFSKGVEQLGHTEPATRVGGVYALERVMRDAPFEQRSVIETLVAFLRGARHPAGATASGSSAASAPPADQAAALRVIGRRRVDYDPEGVEHYGWNLTGLDLSDFSLRSGDFTRVNFWKSDLRRANLRGANLSATVDLNNALLDDAVYDGDTTFPPSFDPTGHGLKRHSGGAGA